MKVRLKPINEQVIVITGASSGIGLSTARKAAKKGAKLVLVARSADALKQLEDEITAAGGQAVSVAADVASEADLRRVSETAVARFGGFDTWVNDAGVGIYGEFDQVSEADARRLFDTNFWGIVHGTKVAADHLRGRGGAIINIGSIESDRAIPLHAYYAASKHAVRGFTDAARMELEKHGAPVSVTLIKPAAINTPFTRNAKNYMESEPNYPPPVYEPEVVADAILFCAARPERDLIVGGGGKFITATGTWLPRAMDKYSQGVIWNQQKKPGTPTRGRDADALHEPSNSLSERGDYDGHVMKTSAYTKAAEHPLLTAATVVGAGLAVAALIGVVSEREEERGWKGWTRHPVRTAGRRTGWW